MGGEEREKKGTREDNSEMIEWEGRGRVATRSLMEILVRALTTAPEL